MSIGKVRGLVLSAVIAAMTTTFISCNSTTINNNDYIEKESIFYVENVGEAGNIYAVNVEGEKTTIGNDFINVMYSEGLNKYILLNAKGDLYTLDKEGNREDIASFVTYISPISSESTSIYYINEEQELYERSKESDTSRRIGKGVTSYEYINEDTISYVINGEYSGLANLYVKKDNEDSIKIANGVAKYQFNEDGSKVSYVSREALYLYDIVTDTKEEVVKEELKQIDIKFANKDDLLYRINENRDNTMGTLYYKVSGKEPILLDEDVVEINQCPSGNGVYYLSAENKLFYRDYKGEESTKLGEDISSIRNVNDTYAFVINNDGNLIKVDRTGNSEKLLEDIEECYPYKDAVVSKINNKIYLDSTEIADDVKKIYLNGDDLIYIKNSGEVIVKDKDSEPKTVINNVKDYLDISLMDKKIYSNLLSINDIEGYWISEIPTTVVMHITDDIYEEVNNFTMTSFPYNITNNTYEGIELTLDSGSERFSFSYGMEFRKIDDNTIEHYMGENLRERYARIDKKTFDEYVDKAKAKGLDWNSEYKNY